MIYENIVKYCNENGIPICEFEKRCGIGNGTVGAYKNDDSKPRLETLEKMEKATGVPIADWLKK